MPPIDKRERKTLASVHLDALRGFAALLVVGYHTREIFLQSSSKPVTPAGTIAQGAQIIHGSYGDEAVMIFFVLSGFLVGGSVLRSVRLERWSWKDYAARRLTRLWIVLIPAIFIGICFDLLGTHLHPHSSTIYQWLPPNSLIASNPRARMGFATILGNMAFLQTILVKPVGTNGPLWSLANEFWYYVTFPLLVLGLSKGPAVLKRVVYLFLAGLVLWFAGWHISELLSVWALGAGLSLFPLRLRPDIADWLSWVLGVGLVPMLIVNRKLPLPGFGSRLSMALYTALLIYVLLHSSKPTGRHLYASLASFLSDLSYPLYLVHVPLLIFVCSVVDNPYSPWSRSAPHLATAFGADMLALLLAWFLDIAFQQKTDKVRSFIMGRRRPEVHVPSRDGTYITG